jgi:hypothetical protein
MEIHRAGFTLLRNIFNNTLPTSCLKFRAVPLLDGIARRMVLHDGLQKRLHARHPPDWPHESEMKRFRLMPLADNIHFRFF